MYVHSHLLSFSFVNHAINTRKIERGKTLTQTGRLSLLCLCVCVCVCVCVGQEGVSKVREECG